MPSVLGLDQLFALFRRKSNFQFSIKAPRAITHEGLLLPDRAQLNDFLRQVDLLGKKLGSILFQLPPSLEFNAGRTTAFLTLFREMHNEDIAFETTARKLVPTWCWRFVYRVSCGSRCRPSRRDCRCQRPRWVEWRCLLPFARLPSEVLLSLRF